MDKDIYLHMDNSYMNNPRLYTLKEKIQILLPLVLVGMGCMLFVHFKLDSLFQNIHCKTILGINGFYWVWSLLFTTPQLLLLLSIVFLEGKNSLYAIKFGEYPRPNKKVFYESQLINGKKAKAKGYGVIIFIFSIIVFLLWGIVQAFNPPEIKKSTYESCSPTIVMNSRTSHPGLNN